MNDSNICLNVGCWTSVAEGWLNIDASPYVKIAKIPVIGSLILARLKAPQFPAVIVSGDLVRGLNLPPESCQLIFASHVLEHLSLSDFNQALDHLYLYLKVGGIVRIIVPDLEASVKDYLSQLSEPEQASKAAHDLMMNSYLGYPGSRRTILDRLKEIFSNSRHQWMWDEFSLTEALEKKGFKNIKRCQYGEWGDPKFELVENPKRHWKAVCLEANK